MAELTAVVGIGQTKYEAKRLDVSMPGLIREAAERALADADCSWRDIDAVVIGKAPDLFEGVMMPELFLADAIGDRRRIDGDDAGDELVQRRESTLGSVEGMSGEHLVEHDAKRVDVGAVIDSLTRDVLG